MASDFKTLCREKGISPSYTRMSIYRFLEEHDHPNAEEIYQGLIDELPTLSKTTVYNVLHLFVKHNFVSVILMHNNEKRYELNDDEHSHFRCKECNAVYDIPKITTTYPTLEGYDVQDEDVMLIGICPKCNE